jgi:hypothetical protein
MFGRFLCAIGWHDPIMGLDEVRNKIIWRCSRCGQYVCWLC